MEIRTYQMNPYRLKREYERTHPNGHFFDADSLKFFGERMSEMRVLQGFAKITDAHGDEHKCWVLSTRQHNYPAGVRRCYYYFDTETYDEIQS